MPVSGPFKIVSSKGNAWNLRELSSGKNYVIHPDYIIQSAKQRKLANTKVQTDDDNSSIDLQLGELPSGPLPSLIPPPVPEVVAPLEIITENADNVAEVVADNLESISEINTENNEIATNATPPIRIQPPRACKQ